MLEKFKSLNPLKKFLFIYVVSLLIVFLFLFILRQSGKNQSQQSSQRVSKTYSVIQFKKEEVYTVSTGDILIGNGIPNALVKVVISPNGETKEEKTDAKGKWTYKIPNTLKDGQYNLTIITEDRFGKVAKIKRYKIKVDQVKENVSDKTQSNSFQLITKADASVTNPGNTCGGDSTQSVEYRCVNKQLCSDDYVKDPNTCLWSQKTNEDGSNSHCEDISSCAGDFPCSQDEKQITYSCEQGTRCYYQYFKAPVSNCRWRRGDIDHFDKSSKCVSDLNCGVKTEPGTSGSGRIGTDDEYERLVGPGWSEWMLALQHQGVFPAIQNGEVVYYSKDAYEKTFCSGTSDCITKIQQYTASDWDGMLNNDKPFFVNVLTDAYWQGCYSFDFLEQYFPEAFSKLTDLQRATLPIGPGGCTDGHNNEDPQKLFDIIQKREIEEAYSQKDPFLNIMNGFEPFVGSRSIYNVVTGYELTNDSDKLNAMMGILIIAPAVKTGSTVGLKAIKEGINSAEAIARGQQFRELLKASDEGLSQAAADAQVLSPGAWGGVQIRRFVVADGKNFGVVGRAPEWSDAERILGKPKFEVGKRLTRPGGIPKPSLLNRFGFFNNVVMKSMKAGRGAVVSRTDVLIPAIDNVRQALYDFERITGRKLPEFEKNLQQLAERGNAYVVGDEYFPKNYAGIGGFYNSVANIIVYKESAYYSDRGIQTLHHEIVHMASKEKGRMLAGGKGWFYDRGVNASESNRVFTGVYELMTDAWADRAMGTNIFSPTSALQTGGYKSKYPDLYRAFDRLYRGNPNVLYDFLEFSIEMDAENFISRVFGYTDVVNFMNKLKGEQWQPDYNSFFEYFRRARGINLRAIGFVGAGAGSAEGLNIIKGEEGEYDPDPIVELGQDFLTDDYEGTGDSYDIIIDEAAGNFVPGGRVDVEPLISRDGSAEDPADYLEQWTLESKDQAGLIKKFVIKRAFAQEPDSVNPLPGGNNCKGACTVVIPPDTTSGKYNLFAYLLNKDGKEVLDKSEPFAVDIVSGSPGNITGTCDGKLEAVCNANGPGKHSVKAVWNIEKDSSVSDSNTCNVYVRGYKEDYSLNPNTGNPSNGECGTGQKTFSNFKDDPEKPITQDGIYRLFVSNGISCLNQPVGEVLNMSQACPPSKNNGKYGDLNKDGNVDGLDYNIERDKVKTRDFSGCPDKPSGETRCADLNNDKNLDVGDLNQWQIYYDQYNP